MLILTEQCILNFALTYPLVVWWPASQSCRGTRSRSGRVCLSVWWHSHPPPSRAEADSAIQTLSGCCTPTSAACQWSLERVPTCTMYKGGGLRSITLCHVSEVQGLQAYVQLHHVSGIQRLHICSITSYHVLSGIQRLHIKGEAYVHISRVQRLHMGGSIKYLW